MIIPSERKGKNYPLSPQQSQGELQEKQGFWWAREQWKWGCPHFGIERAKSHLGAKVDQVWLVWLQTGPLHVPWINVLTHPLSPLMPSQTGLLPTSGALCWKCNVIHCCWALCVCVFMALQKQLLWLSSSLLPLYFFLVVFPLIWCWCSLWAYLAEF